MAKFFITAHPPIGEKTIEADDFEAQGGLVVFTTAIRAAAGKVYAIAIDKVISIERQSD